MAPAREAVMMATGYMPCWSATIMTVTEAMAETPAARPSRPSMRFTTLVRLTIQKT
mgnify:CR=1 FL=1